MAVTFTTGNLNDCLMKELILLKRYYDINKTRVKFDGGCLKQDQGTLLHGGIVNIYIV